MLVHRVRFGSSLDKELDDQLRKLHNETRVPISRLLDEAIEDLLRKHKVLKKRSTKK
jgi:post-segregation antitoxin (ccd killing protein)